MNGIYTAQRKNTQNMRNRRIYTVRCKKKGERKMFNYDYTEAMKEDIRDYLNENSIIITDVSAQYDDLYDDLWVCDSVTGNASGSYTFSSNTAKEYVLDNMDLLEEAAKEFCLDNDTIAEKFLSDCWEYFDVTIRCYLLGQVLSEVLDDEERA